MDTKDIDELRTWDMDIRQVLSDNAIKDMLADEEQIEGQICEFTKKGCEIPSQDRCSICYDLHKVKGAFSVMKNVASYRREKIGELEQELNAAQVEAAEHQHGCHQKDNEVLALTDLLEAAVKERDALKVQVTDLELRNADLLVHSDRASTRYKELEAEYQCLKKAMSLVSKVGRMDNEKCVKLEKALHEATDLVIEIINEGVELNPFNEQQHRWGQKNEELIALLCNKCPKCNNVDNIRKARRKRMRELDVSTSPRSWSWHCPKCDHRWPYEEETSNG